MATSPARRARLREKALAQNAARIEAENELRRRGLSCGNCRHIATYLTDNSRFHCSLNQTWDTYTPVEQNDICTRHSSHILRPGP